MHQFCFIRNNPNAANPALSWRASAKRRTHKFKADHRLALSVARMMCMSLLGAELHRIGARLARREPKSGPNLNVIPRELGGRTLIFIPKFAALNAFVSSRKISNGVTKHDYYEVTRDCFTPAETRTILPFVGSSGGGLPGACDLRVGRRF